MNIDISFIVPVYNKKIEELERCISSILMTKKINYEVILIDDGSDDILSKKYKKYATAVGIKYIYQRNRGVSAARNLGINEAEGNYLMFIDADDYILPKAINSEILKTTYDLIIFSVEKKNFSRGSDQIFRLAESDRRLSCRSLLMYTLYDGLMNWSVAKCYSREFIKKNKLLFNVDIQTGEDLDFIINFLLSSPTAMYINQVIYVYEYQDSTGIDRILSNPDKAIENVDYLFYKRRTILSYLKLSNRRAIKSDLRENYFNSLFDIISIFCFYQKDKIDLVYNRISKSIANNQINIDDIKLTTKLKLCLVQKRHYYYFYIIYKYKRIIKKIMAHLFNTKIKKA